MLLFFILSMSFAASWQKHKKLSVLNSSRRFRAAMVKIIYNFKKVIIATCRVLDVFASVHLDFLSHYLGAQSVMRKWYTK